MAKKLVTWEIAKQKVHDASNVHNPGQWLWVKIQHVYYPSEYIYPTKK